MTGRLTYLGPEGTFSEQAVRTLPEYAAATSVRPALSVLDALDSVRRGDDDAALVPYESSVEGSVGGTLDALAAFDAEPLVIVREAVLPVSFALLARPGTMLGDVRTVGTIGPAEAQCRDWLRVHLPGVPVMAAPSTAEAARSLAAGGAPWDAAISAPVAADRYGLDILASGVGDNAAAMTRFVLVTRPSAPPAPTGSDRTTVVLFERDDHAGSLMEMLTEFAVRGINLTWLTSRPTGERLGSYCFGIDLEGHIADPRVGEALAALYRLCRRVVFLGSYPRAHGAATYERPGTGEKDFAAAAEWLDALRREGYAP